jgi:hypothetical protein
MSETHRLDFPDFLLVYLRGAETDAEIELTVNKAMGILALRWPTSLVPVVASRHSAWRRRPSRNFVKARFY